MNKAVQQLFTAGTYCLQATEMSQVRVVMRLQRAAGLVRAATRQPQWKARSSTGTASDATFLKSAAAQWSHSMHWVIRTSNAACIFMVKYHS